MKKLFLLGACLLALSGSPVMAQVAAPDIVVVRVYDGSVVQFVIVRGEGKTEMMKFDGGFTDKRMVSVGEAYYQLYNKLYQEGYVLQNTVTTSTTATTMLFVKAPKP
jgi:hypothetical protein